MVAPDLKAQAAVQRIGFAPERAAGSFLPRGRTCRAVDPSGIVRRELAPAAPEATWGAAIFRRAESGANPALQWPRRGAGRLAGAERAAEVKDPAGSA
ncbi:MAG: hypothetical protein ABS35_25530 [Kaistia sp. SCN 65-12]|nr:MAG: hypothetical protein ABS35_25530 [Kaistia sp. SCN 65-12]